MRTAETSVGGQRFTVGDRKEIACSVRWCSGAESSVAVTWGRKR
jgi:hypothetical protein